MKRRTYNQFCMMAYALDMIGERWTLLIVRDLLMGPKRFGDLLAGLPGIGPNLLTKRLKHLIDIDVAERRALPPPAGSTVYALTERGVALEDVVMSLAWWGKTLMSRPRPGEVTHIRWLGLALRHMELVGPLPHAPLTVLFVIDGEPLQLSFADGQLRTSELVPDMPHAQCELSRETFNALVFGGAQLRDADVLIHGSAAAVEAALAPFVRPRADA